MAISAVAGLAALTWGIIVFLLPPSVGEALVGVSWDTARHLVIPLAIAAAAGGVAVGATSGLKALQATGRIFRTRLVESVITISAVVVGATWGGAPGLAKAAAVGSTLSTIIWWRQFRRTLRMDKVRKSALTPSE